MSHDYTAWSNSDLITRITSLEAQLRSQNSTFNLPSPQGPSPQRSKKPKKISTRVFDSSRYSSRLIALKFAYLGQRYNGFEHHANNKTPLPTIEEVVWKALRKTRLISPVCGDGREGKDETEEKDGEVDWTGCEYSKCGRTGKGVSAFGQVIGIRVRSNRPLVKTREAELENGVGKVGGEEHDGLVGGVDGEWTEQSLFDPIRDELPYIQLLNRVLPEDIRVLAWCPSPPPDFSARFNCKERRYRYFFTQPAFAPVPGDRGLFTTSDGKKLRDGWLDIEAMQDAAKRYEGLHDFRNLCKVDPAKQITNFERRIFHASIEKVDPIDGSAGYVGQPDFGQRGPVVVSSNGTSSHAGHGGPPTVYSFNVNGSAFLWHQVRHLVAVLFLVGQGLEPPSIVSDLLDISKTPRRPKYEMANDAPLVLWDCIFPEGDSDGRGDALYWVYIGDDGGRETNKRPELDGGDGKFGRNGVMDDLWSVWHRRKIDEVLAGSLLDVVARQGRQSSLPADPVLADGRSARVFDGGHSARTVGTYTPILQKERMEAVEAINARYAERKGLMLQSAGQAMDLDE